MYGSWGYGSVTYGGGIDAQIIERVLVSISSSIFLTSRVIGRELQKLVSILSSVFSTSTVIRRELQKLVSILSSVFSSSKRERPKGLIKDIRIEKTKFDIKNVP
jgi:hypothetical protein